MSQCWHRATSLWETLKKHGGTNLHGCTVKEHCWGMHTMTVRAPDNTDESPVTQSIWGPLPPD